MGGEPLVCILGARTILYFEQRQRPQAKTPNLNVQRPKCIVTAARMSIYKIIEILSNYLLSYILTLRKFGTELAKVSGQ